jgi:hypothetical protein
MAGTYDGAQRAWTKEGGGGLGFPRTSLEGGVGGREGIPSAPYLFLSCGSKLDPHS